MQPPLVRYMLDAVLVAKLSWEGQCTSRRVVMAKDRMIATFRMLTAKQQKMATEMVREMEKTPSGSCIPVAVSEAKGARDE